MKKNLKKLTLLLATLSLVSIICSTQAEAAYRISFTANEEGLVLSYNLPLIAGIGALQLKNDGVPMPINLHMILPLLPLATINLSIAEINAAATPPSIKIHYAITGSTDAIPNTEGDFDLPFCAGEIKIAFFKLFGAPILEEHDLKAYVLLRNDKTVYDYAFNMPTITGSGAGEVTPDADNNTATITETITLNMEEFGSKNIEVTLTFDYSIPFFTQIHYVIQLPSSPLEGDLTLPNARVRMWFDLQN